MWSFFDRFSLASLVFSFQIPTLLSLGTYWHFPANLLFCTHLNVCCLIRCTGGLEFRSPSLLTLLHSSGLFIPPSCALKVKLPFTKPLQCYLRDLATPQWSQPPAGRDHDSPWRRTTEWRGVCVRERVCLEEFDSSTVVYLLSNCPNMCDNRLWWGNRPSTLGTLQMLLKYYRARIATGCVFDYSFDHLVLWLVDFILCRLSSKCFF